MGKPIPGKVLKTVIGPRRRTFLHVEKLIREGWSFYSGFSSVNGNRKLKAVLYVGDRDGEVLCRFVGNKVVLGSVRKNRGRRIEAVEGVGPVSTKEVSRKLVYKHLIPKRSIQHCLVVLGAPWAEVYRDKKIKTYRAPTHNPIRGTLYMNSIYKRFSDGELLEWVEYLYRIARKRYHPDRHATDKQNHDFYLEKMKQVNQAYDTATSLLRHRMGFVHGGYIDSFSKCEAWLAT